MTGSTNLSVQAPDIAAAMQLASVLAQASCDVWIEPQTGQRYRVRGTANIPTSELCALMTGWIEREQICCAELLLGDDRYPLALMLGAPIRVAA